MTEEKLKIFPQWRLHLLISCSFNNFWLQFLLEKMLETPNILKASKTLNKYECLEKLRLELSKCEKALSEFLETKRLIYPRFYFISPLDLLDILANGNQPKLVSRSVKLISHHSGEKSILALPFDKKYRRYVLDSKLLLPWLWLWSMNFMRCKFVTWPKLDFFLIFYNTWREVISQKGTRTVLFLKDNFSNILRYYSN